MSLKVTCERDFGDKVADAISEPLITTSTQAVIRGKRFLDDPALGGYYITKTFAIQVPHKVEGLKKGDFIDLTESTLKLSTKVVKVTECELVGTRDTVWANLTVQSYEAPVI